MANVSLDSQTFFDPLLKTGRKSINSLRNGAYSASSPRGQKQPEQDACDHRRSATGSSPVDVILVSSESDVAGIGDSFSTTSNGGSLAKQTLSTETTGSDGQKSELLALATGISRSALKGIRVSSEEPSLGEMAEPSQATGPSQPLTTPGVGGAVASSPSPSSPKPLSPVLLQTDPPVTNGAENPPETTLRSSPDEDVIDLRGSGLRRTAQLSQERARGSERSPAPPITTLSQRLSGSSRVVRQDEPAIEGSNSCETRRTPPPEGTPSGKNAAEISLAISPRVKALHVRASNLPAMPSPRLENDTHRDSMLHRATVSNGDREDEAMLPRIQPKARRARAAVRRHHRRSVKDVTNNFNKMQDVRSDNDKGIPNACRLANATERANSGHNVGPRRDASNEEVSTSSQESDSEWDTRSPQRKGRKSGLPKPARTKATGQEISSDSGSTGSRHVRIASPSPAQAPGEQLDSVKALSAKFTEWLLKATVVRSAIVDGVTTFQLQFKADRYCSKHRHYVLSSSQFDGGSNSRPSTSVASTPGKDPPVSQSDNDKVEKIREIRKRGRGHQARPLKNFSGTAALDEYEVQHRNIAPGLGL
ncbi:hypothetical protein F5X98DRAFT_368702 [Xylaria grammica]|nr:hypothetical protein F5X98DRAFT_368702 [Xylaria grammica]